MTEIFVTFARNEQIINNQALPILIRISPIFPHRFLSPFCYYFPPETLVSPRTHPRSPRPQFPAVLAHLKSLLTPRVQYYAGRYGHSDSYALAATQALAFFLLAIARHVVVSPGRGQLAGRMPVVW